MKELNIIEGSLNASFLKESGIWLTKRNPLRMFLPIIYHVDSYQKTNKLGEDIYRIQGYFYVSDFLRLDNNDEVPDELEKAKKEIGLREGRPIVMLWDLTLMDDLPF